jgi:hypothetical protein
MSDKRSLRLDEDFIIFLKRACSTYHIKHNGERPFPHQMASLIVSYFKLNNDRYFELINMEVKTK